MLHVLHVRPSSMYVCLPQAALPACAHLAGLHMTLQCPLSAMWESFLDC